MLIGKREVREQVSHSDAYYGKTQPPQLQAVEGHKVFCIKTGRTFIQSNLDDVFLVLVAMTSQKPIMTRSTDNES